jgi:hypothetical protein
MKKHCFLVLPLLALLVTGCPHNDYTVKLTPHGNQMQRELAYYRADGQDSNRVPKYESFPGDEHDAIVALYPSHSAAKKGEVHIVKGEFFGAMPADVGGAGAYTNITTSMGSAGFYGERFRGDDDLAGQIEKRLNAANQLVDVVIGWSKAELGSETNYAQLRQFLDGQFRKDVKNAAFYWRQAQEAGPGKTNINEEYDVRFALYLVEREYFKLGDMPALLRMMAEDDDKGLMLFIQRLVARKLGVDDTQPLPKSLAFLDSSDAMNESFSNYFIGTDLYRANVKEWKKKHDNEPAPDEIIMKQAMEVIGFDINLFGGTSDHLTVKLSLPEPPAHTNGKWDEATKQVIWDSDIEGKTNAALLPVVCYASWGQPDAAFQTNHFGRVFLKDEDLTMYCLWKAGLDERRSLEWENLLTTLQPGEGLIQKVKGFRFSDEKEVADEVQQSPSYLARSLLEEGLARKPAESRK